MIVDSSPLRKMRVLLEPSERRSLVVLFGLMLIGMIFETLGVSLVIPAIALLNEQQLPERLSALKPLIAAFGHPGRDVLIIAGMVTLVVVYLVKNLFLAVLAWRQARFAQDLNVHLSQRLFTTYLSQPYTFHLQRNSALLINTIVKEVDMVTAGGVSPGLMLCAEIVVLAGLGTLLVVVEPVGAIIVGAAVAMSAWGFQRLTSNRTDRWALARQYHDDMSIQHLQQGLGAAKDVILLGRESEFLSQYLWHTTRRAHAGQRNDVMQQLPRLALEFLAITSLAALTLAMLAQDRPPAVVLPTLGLFAAVAFRVLPSVNRILNCMQLVRFAAPSVGRLYDDLTTLTPSAIERPRGTSRLRKAIELLDVTYTYPSSTTPALTRVSLRIEQGAFVGIVGASGDGKTTLIDVLLGLLVPEAGNVLVDGQDIRQDLRGWQDQIGYVPQDIYLTDDTLRRNIAFGLADQHIDEIAVWSALRAAQLEHFVQGLPDGLDTLVGERGIRISGGERQRIGIARALYHDPEILVLDEATSSLDTGTERGVMDTVRDLQHRKTIIIVTHRLTTIENCDHVYEMKRGSVVGTPAHLIRANPA